MARLERKTVTGKTILLVDDQEDYRAALQSLLSREGHDVVEASSGEEALAQLRRHPIDLLLLDYFMPGGMNGEETMKEVRKEFPLLQVILQTGYSGETAPREMLNKLDIQGYHDKTDGPEKLLLWVDIGLKAAATIQQLGQKRP